MLKTLATALLACAALPAQQVYFTGTVSGQTCDMKPALQMLGSPWSIGGFINQSIIRDNCIGGSPLGNYALLYQSTAPAVPNYLFPLDVEAGLVLLDVNPGSLIRTVLATPSTPGIEWLGPSLGIPNDPALVGTPVYTQAAMEMDNGTWQLTDCHFLTIVN